MKTKIMALTAVIALLAILSPALGAGQAATSLKNVAFQKTDKGFDVTLAIEGEFLYQVQTLAGPARLAIDLSPISRIEAPAYTEANLAGLNSIRTGQFSTMIARVMLDFGDILPRYEVAKTDAGLVLHFSTGAAPAEKPAVTVPPVVTAPVRERPVPAVKPAETGGKTEAGEGPEGFVNTMIGAQIGSYQVPSAPFKEIYGADATGTIGLSLSRTLIQYGALSFDVEGGIRFYSKTGASTPDLEATTFKMTPISLAGRLNYQWKYFQVFAGYGFDWYSYSETSTLTPEPTTGNATGHHFTAGIYLIPPVLDGMLRVKAYYKSTKVTAIKPWVSIDLGGNEVGVGLSLGFNLFKKGVLSF